MIVHFPEVERKAIAELAQRTLWEENTEDVAEALKYLRETRGLSDETIKGFRFGYYPQRLKKQGHDWAGRLIMPLYDQNNNLIVLTSRDFRYKDGPGMPHLHEEFDKKFYMFGMNVAKPNIIKHQKAIVVEGQFDTACSHTFGFDVTVGILGSAFSMYHLSVLSRYCSDIFLVFDIDSSGFQNLRRSMEMYKTYGLEGMGIRFIPVILPSHKDPDKFLKEVGPSEYRKLLVEAKQKTMKLGSSAHYVELCKSNPQIRVEAKR